MNASPQAPPAYSRFPAHSGLKHEEGPTQQEDAELIAGLEASALEAHIAACAQATGDAAMAHFLQECGHRFDSADDLHQAGLDVYYAAADAYRNRRGAAPRNVRSPIGDELIARSLAVGERARAEQSAADAQLARQLSQRTW